MNVKSDAYERRNAQRLRYSYEYDNTVFQFFEYPSYPNNPYSNLVI